MSINRGDVTLYRFPHVTGARGKKRPVVIVQADGYNSRLRHVIVAEVTTNMAEANDPAHLLIDVSTPEGMATGLVQNSLVSCVLLSSISADRVPASVGKLSPALLAQLDDCLKAALGL